MFHLGGGADERQVCRLGGVTGFDFRQVCVMSGERARKRKGRPRPHQKHRRDINKETQTGEHWEHGEIFWGYEYSID